MIIFRFAQQHDAQGFLWLSPSEYIARTQLTNAMEADPAAEFTNITFMTYARLIYLDEAALLALKPYYIILDEFHRCGAEMWGDGVQRLLQAYPHAKIIGLSATKIRYLDHQRDMVEELFEGHIASEMSLGEAIVRGILPAPRYVTTIYRYQHSLEKYEKRIACLSSKRHQECSAKYYQAFRRTLEKADGLELVLKRHLTQVNGRYIVFCANVNHMMEIKERIPDWFHDIDAKPHCYLIHADDVASSTTYQAFCEDNSDHLKLLLCVNMLNEGVHVRGISGVILFRPTTSPIIYKQQIGRALTTGSESVPLILDVVNNVEGLYSIASIQEEMLAAAGRLRQEGRADLIVQESFTIIDQVKDCRQLFEQLEGSLHIDWEEYYQAAAAYREENGDLLIPQRYVSPDGKCLGAWLQSQRNIRSGNKMGILTEVQIARLDELGIVWENQKDLTWDHYFRAAEQYFHIHGHLAIPTDYVTADGQKLGVWLVNTRMRYAHLREKDQSPKTMERIAKLEEIGMVWNVNDSKWEQGFAEAYQYAAKHGDLLIPVHYQTPNGFKLGVWIANQRSKYKGNSAVSLREEQIQKLEQIGMVWSANEANWMRYYNAAKRYYESHGNLKIGKQFRTEDGLSLGVWVAKQKRLPRENPATDNLVMHERIRLLHAIGIT